ncbi:hypothetical protein EG329_009593 [Mollisiaceae sp. DMI_Dod_QoI]|nr:hypothetical protein EG329_009593 [Helotiales sp. DMI_Dod_QoI]
MAPGSFTNFPELPSELRLKIWEYALPGPRILGVGHKTQYKTIYGRAIPTIFEWRTSDPVPSILHACHESREEALKNYRPSFGIPLQQGKNYIDFSKETIYFGGSGRGFRDLETLLQSTYGRPSNYLLDMFLGADTGVRDAEHIQSMIVDIDEDRYGRRSFIWEEIRLFARLRDLVVIVWEEDSQANRLMEFYRSSLREVANKHHEWAVPEIKVLSATTKGIWGTIDSSVRLVEEEEDV